MFSQHNSLVISFYVVFIYTFIYWLYTGVLTLGTKPKCFNWMSCPWLTIHWSWQQQFMLTLLYNTNLEVSRRKGSALDFPKSLSHPHAHALISNHFLWKQHTHSYKLTKTRASVWPYSHIHHPEVYTMSHKLQRWQWFTVLACLCALMLAHIDVLPHT